MNEEKLNIKKWIYWFLLGLAIIIAYNVIANISGIWNCVKNLLDVLMPFCIGILTAYILYLPCKKIEKICKKTKRKNFINKHSRGISIFITYIIAIIIIIIILNVIIPIVIQSLTDLVSNLPNYYNSIIDSINNLPEDNILRSEQVTQIIQNLQNIDFQSLINIERIQSYIQGVIGAVEKIFNIFISMVVSVYILSQRNKIIKFLSRLTHVMFKESKYNKIKDYFVKSNDIFFKFLTSQILDAIIVGILVSIAMSLIGVKYAVLLGFMIGIFNLIPYFGAIIAIVISILITILTGGFGQAIIMGIIVIILQQIDANVINPKIVGNSLQISQLLVIFAVTVGGAYFGVLGMFLAVPIVAIISIIIEDIIKEKENKRIE